MVPDRRRGGTITPRTPLDDFGEIDIYLFDQLLKGRITPSDRILDAGCGSGRNLVYLLRSGFDVSAVDANPHAIREVSDMAGRLAPHVSPDRFRVESVERMSFAPSSFTVVLSSAVLHFAPDSERFAAMLAGMWSVLASGGLFFARLATTIGMEGRIVPASAASTPVDGGNNRYRLPDGTERYLVDEATLLGWTARLGGKLLDPLKTTVVQDQRSMTTWVVRKD